MTEAKGRCRTCWRTGHTARAHSGLTNAELEQVKKEGQEFMARGFRELGEQAPDGDLFDVLRADTERAELASVEAPNEEEPTCWCPDPADQTEPGESWAVDCPRHGKHTRSADPMASGPGEPMLYPIGTAEQDGWHDVSTTGVAPVLSTSVAAEQGPQFAPWRTVFGPDGPKLITLPGVYDLDAQEYHDPAVTGDWLSNSDARQLIGKGCPAQYRYDKDHGVQEENEAFAMGHAVHARILGKGEKIAVRPAEFDSWRTNASKAWRREQEAAGRSVIIPEQAEVVEAMAAAVHSKPDAHRLLSQPGRPEMSLFWVDPETGVRRRTMVDYLPSVVDEYGVMEPVDIKSADEVAPNEDMERKLYNHAWHRQGTTIADGIVALGLASEVSFHFVVQSKKAPHLVTVVKLDAEAERIGHIENREALHVYKRCLETDEWPDFTPEGPVTMTVPVWVARLYEEDIR